jgi:hypothetical protein
MKVKSRSELEEVNFGLASIIEQLLICSSIWRRIDHGHDMKIEGRRKVRRR